MADNPPVTVRAPAKINLYLGVGAPRSDGYHPLATVYQAIGIYDDVTVLPAEEWSVTVHAEQHVDASPVPTGDDNLAVRAGRLLAAHHDLEAAAQVTIRKAIPVAGGMAGGSADAAAALLALDRLWGLGTTDQDLLALAASLGSDVPFALLGGTAAGTGHGEQVSELADAGTWWWVVALSEVGLSTPAVYRRFDEGSRPLPKPTLPPALLEALRVGDPEALAGWLHNDLQEAALDLRPDLVGVLADGRTVGALAGLVSGSGPTCFFLCDDSGGAHEVRHGLLELGYEHVLAAPGPVAGVHVTEYV